VQDFLQARGRLFLFAGAGGVARPQWIRLRLALVILFRHTILSRSEGSILTEEGTRLGSTPTQAPHRR